MNEPRGRSLCSIFVFVILLLQARPAWADASAPPESGQPPESAPKAQAPSGATVLQSRDGRDSLKLGMSVQADLRLPQSGSGLESTFLVRRARLGLTGTLASAVDARLIADFGQGSTPIFQDAWLDLRFTSWLRLRAGRLKVPVGYEWLETSSNYLDFVEQSLVYSLLLPRYDNGVALHGEFADQRAEYWLGLFNEASGKVRDEDSGKMVAGRLAVSPVEGVSFAVSGTHALGDNLPEEVRKTLPTGLAILADQDTLKYAGGTTGLYVVPPEWRLAAEAISYLGPTSLKVEYSRLHSPARDGWLRASDVGEDDKRVQLPGLRSQAVYASGTVVLTGEKRTDKGVAPARPFDPAAGHLGAGAWELTARYGFAQLRFERGQTEQDVPAEQHIHELTAGLNWYLNSSTRFMFNVSRYSFLRDKPPFHEVLMRVQWTF
ncbi:OprO/OprP family phosphate-selective porin [Cystobacter fuscus]|uniref:OprO/OprP family phosphate-selective porin n=1 Tax=Cystobacter fuscus TaxID=43 RepID=UPI002B2B7D4B|nr:hypothetical protein F0U63_24965 [Cystobacter fuscus]